MYLHVSKSFYCLCCYVFVLPSASRSTKNVLGKGGFGEVYKAEFRGQAVAVKIFSQKVAAINNATPNHLVRQEVGGPVRM